MSLNRSIAPPSQELSWVQIPEVKTTILANHIPLHLIQAGEQEVCRLEVIYKAGTTTEAKNNISYLTAKMLPCGTKRHDEASISEYFERYGASFEPHHSPDRVILTLYCLTKFLPKVLPLLIEILQESIFPEKELAQLKNISLQNLKVNLEKNNYVAGREFRRLLFQSYPPYASSLEEKALEEASQNDLFQHYQKHIQHQPFELILTGKVDTQSYEYVARTFEQLGIQSPITMQFVPSCFQPVHDRYCIETAHNLQASIRMGKLCLPKNHPDFFAFNVLNEALGGYFGSRLMKNIREEKGYTYGIYSQIVHLEKASYQVISTDVKQEYAQATIEEIQREIYRLQTELIEKQELTRLKNYLLGSFASMLSNCFDLAEIFKGIHFFGLSYHFYQQYWQTIHQISPEILQETAKKYLQPEKMLTVVVGTKLEQ
ncbi:MAG: insulinase family protein [Microscillaceae bacterium]|nr:insulinase family protein [Microscillaceae bacterium]MDW8460268.1 pitrilysin family protein [Cytophagales bacterium]